MADVELLPLPELPRQVEGYNSDYWEAGQIEEYAADYARACVEANLATLQAEIETLRAEVARKEALLETGNMFREAMCNEMRAAGCKVVATPDTIEVRNTRADELAEALRKLEEREQSDEALLRQALEALEQIATDLPWELTGLQADTIAALRERLGKGMEQKA